MNGPEHYRAAESRLELAIAAAGVDDVAMYHITAAQVHATLALAAATAEAYARDLNTPDWAEVIR